MTRPARPGRGGSLWTASLDLTEDERARLTSIEGAARAEAAVAARLTDAEAEAVHEAQRRASDRREELESQMAPDDPNIGVLVAGLRQNASDELRAITAAIGPARAAALRKAERDAYRRLTRQSDLSGGALVAMRGVARRRLLFLAPATAPASDQARSPTQDD